MDQELNVSVAQRGRPDYDPPGIRMGGFVAYPSLTLGTLFDDNVLATDDRKRSDVALVVAPELRLVNVSSRHRLSLALGAEILRYREETGQNSEQAFLRGDARASLASDLDVLARAEVARLREDPDDAEATPGDEAVTYIQAGGDVGLERRFNRLSVALTGGASRLDYDNSGGTDDEDRDRVVVATRARATYAQSARVGYFVQTELSRDFYDESQDRNGVERDKAEVNVQAGTALDFTSVLFGEASAGVARTASADSGFGSETAFTFAANLTWNPTQLTSLQLLGSRDFRPTTQADSSVNLQTLITLDVTHELRRNVIVGGGVGYRQNKFEGDGTEDNDLFAGLRLVYLVNRRLSFGVGYEYTVRDSDEADREFHRNQVLFTVTGRL